MRQYTLFLCFLLCAFTFSFALEVSENSQNLVISTSKLKITIEKNPWRMSVHNQAGKLLTTEGDPRQGGNPPAPPTTPWAYYLDERPFSPLTYRVDRTTRIWELGQEIAPGETFRVNKVVEWTEENGVVSLICSTTELDDLSVIHMKVNIHFPKEHVFHLKASLSKSKGVWNFSETFANTGTESFFALGQHFDQANCRGFVRGMQPEYSPQSKSTHNKTHVLVPFYMSSEDFGVFSPIRRRGYFDMGASFSDLSRFAFDSDYLEFFFISDSDPKKVCQEYMAMTGLPPVYPQWVFAPHQWRNVIGFEDEIYDDMKEMRHHNLPGSVIWIDNPWQTDYNNFKIDPKQFPDPSRLFQDMQARGYKVAFWSSEFVNENSAQYADAWSKRYFLAFDKQDKEAFLMPWANGYGAPVDFHKAEVRSWWQEKINSCMEIGISGWKLDYGEIEDGVTAFRLPYLQDPGFKFYSNGKKIVDVGSYRMDYHRTFNEVIQKKYDGNGFLICRTGAFGDQVNNPCIWPGDLDNDFSFHKDGIVGGLPAAIAGGISVSLSGFPYYGSDIGGFKKGTPTKESLIRWTQFAALSPVMQLGGGGNHRPWDMETFDQETLDIYRKYSRLHTDLFPYLYTYVHESGRTGLPIMRALFMHYPKDYQASQENFEYMFGDNLLVAPVYQEARERKVYLPEGQWVDYWNQKVYQGPTQFIYQAPLDTLPLFVKKGSIIPLADPEIDTLAPATDPSVVTWEQKKDHLRLQVYPSEFCQFTLYDGSRFEAEEQGNTIVLRSNSKEQRRFSWTVYPEGNKTVSRVELGSITLKKFTSSKSFTKAVQGWYQEEGNSSFQVKVASSKVAGDVRVTLDD